MKRLRRPKLRETGRSLLLRDRGEPATQPMGAYPYPDPSRYQAAPVGPARLPEGADEPTIRTHTAAGAGAGLGWAMIVNEDAPAIPMDARVRKAHLSLQLAAEDLAAQGMLYRIDDAEQARQRGEELDERSVIALTVAKAVRHLMGAREPWDPGGWDHGVGTQPQPQPGPVVDVAWPGDTAGWRADIERELGGDAA